MGHSAHSFDVRSQGQFKFSSTVKGSLLGALVIGAAAIAYAMMKMPERAWPNFLINYFFFTGLAACGVLFVAIQHMTNAYWSVTLRRVLEGFMSFLPAALVLGVVVFLGRHHLYEWTHHHAVVAGEKMSEHAHLLHEKAPYLNSTFFGIRLFGFLILWMILGFGLRKNSLAQDGSGDGKLTLKNIKLSAATIPLVALTFTLFSFDLMMSLEPTWFSTIFGVYCFAGIMYSGMSLLAIFLIYGRRTGVFSNEVINENHLHDVGKMMFTFVVFWMYVVFSQQMLQWYANLPEETPYYIRRFKGPWWNYSIALFILHFVAPFLLLVSRHFKRNEKHLFRMAILMLIAQWMDVYYMVVPVFFPNGPVFGWVEVGTMLGFIGLFGTMVSRFLEKVPAVPVRDPRLEQCLAHNQ